MQRTNLPEYCRRLVLLHGWTNPFWLPMLPHLRFLANETVETACVYENGDIIVSPSFTARLTDEELFSVIVHEMLHLLVLTHYRRGNRNPSRWNVASDRAINYVIKQSKLTPIPGMLLPLRAEHEKMCAEELYELEIDPPTVTMQINPDGTIKVSVGNGCGTIENKPNGGDGNDQQKKQKKDGAQDGQGPSGRTPESVGASNWTDHWRGIAAQTIAGAGIGSEMGNLLAQLSKFPEPPIKWSEILRGQLARAYYAHGRDDLTWTRKSRRSGPTGPQMPGWISYKASAAVVIDSSGSMSDETLAMAVSHTVAISQAIGIKLFLVVHDVGVHIAQWIRPGTPAPDVGKLIIGRGGTDFTAAYNAIAEVKNNFDVMVHLTDGGVHRWPQRPKNAKKLVVALLGYKTREALPNEGETVIDADVA